MIETFGQRLRRIRKEKAITQSQLSEKTGLPQCQISSYENERYSPNISTVEWLCKALNVTASELLGF